MLAMHCIFRPRVLRTTEPPLEVRIDRELKITVRRSLFYLSLYTNLAQIEKVHPKIEIYVTVTTKAPTSVRKKKLNVDVNRSLTRDCRCDSTQLRCIMEAAERISHPDLKALKS